MEIRETRYDHPDAVRLIAQVQQEYIQRYGDPDETPVDAGHFDPPHGSFLVGYLDAEPVATGGWRAQEASLEGFADGDAELKRMYVVPQARGRGLARAILAALEAGAATAGRARVVLETGSRQPEAIALYASCGYTPIAKFGMYRDHELSVCMGKSLAPDLVPHPPAESVARPVLQADSAGGEGVSRVLLATAFAWAYDHGYRHITAPGAPPLRRQPGTGRRWASSRWRTV